MTIPKDDVLIAWKKAVKMAGFIYFILPSFYDYFFQTEECIKNVVSIKQLAPNWKVIGLGLKRMLPHQKAFIGLLHRFYDAKAGQRLLSSLGFSTVALAKQQLTTEELAIIEILFNNENSYKGKKLEKTV